MQAITSPLEHTPELDQFGEAYLRLVLELNKHIDGYVDAYFGPANLKAEVAAAPIKSVEQLRHDLNRLHDLLPIGDVERTNVLLATLRAVDCSIRMLAGEAVDYFNEVSSLFDVTPVLIEEADFVSAHKTLDAILPGSSPLPERLDQWRKQYDIAPERLLRLLEVARDETRRRTVVHFPLIENESIEIALTRNQPWRAYNWYKGNARSLIEFNTDVYVSALDVADLFAHEAYPGHHTEHQIKESTLYRQKGYGEHAVQLLLTPAAVISEGIATTAVEIIFSEHTYPEQSHFAWTAEVLIPEAGMPPTTADQLMRYGQAVNALRYVRTNAAILYHTGKMDETQAVNYCMTYGLVNEARAKQMFRFLSNPLFRAYVFTYTAGYDLMNAASQKSGGDKKPLFSKLLFNDMLPSQIAALI